MDMNMMSVAPIISASIIDKRRKENKFEYKSKAKRKPAEETPENEPAIIYEAGSQETTHFATYSRPGFIKH